MYATKLRTIIISLDDLVDVQAALDLLRAGKGLSAPESGVVAYDKVTGQTLLGEPVVKFDGFKYTVFLFVTSG